ncbi:MAG TPA: hypothetical protein VEO19_01910 [Terriglobia bacterium]|nr:hypothetical protein [Terriglobia bacterium]
MNRTLRILLLVTVPGLLAVCIRSSAQETPNGWAPFEYLLGDWVGEGGGQPGQGAGEFSFHLDLQNRILVRKNYAAYPPANGRAAFRHDDLTVVYRESEKSPLKAVYFDSEGHVIHYAVAVSSDQKTIEFVSEVLPSSPRYRFTYVKTGSASVALKFEIAPPGKPDAFSTYIEAKAKRK